MREARGAGLKLPLRERTGTGLSADQEREKARRGRVCWGGAPKHRQHTSVFGFLFCKKSGSRTNVVFVFVMFFLKGGHPLCLFPVSELSEKCSSRACSRDAVAMEIRLVACVGRE